MKTSPLLLWIMIIFASGAAATTNSSPADYTQYFRYVSPRPGAQFVPRGAALIFRHSDRLKALGVDLEGRIQMEGELSGVHGGRWLVADDGETYIFKPDRQYTPGERVKVSVNGGRRGQIFFRFTVSPKTRALHIEDDVHPVLGNAEETVSTKTDRAAAAVTLPADFPTNTVTVPGSPGGGVVFAASVLGDAKYLMILDDLGAPQFFRSFPARVSDFKMHWNGLLTYSRRDTDRFYAMDNTYTVVDSFAAGNGYTTDFHDFLILPNGNYLLMIYDPQTVDMSRIVVGGDPEATVVGLVIQEQDPSRNVVFEWRSWDHFEITDAVDIDLTQSRIDYAHGNAFDVDGAGNIVVSSRNMNEVTKIDRQTGNIIWRMGGKNNEFTLIDDTEWFTRQHDCRYLSDGNMTVFNNGNLNTPQESRVVEYALDETNRVATLVWEYRHVPSLYAPFTGNAQRLPNGNTLVSWGNTGVVTEVRPDKSIAWELTYDSNRTYRAFRFPWAGVAAVPTLWDETTWEQITLHFTKFGDDNVDHYNIYQGDLPNPTSLVGTTTDNSFTITEVSEGEVWYFRVTAVDAQMNETDFSNELRVTVPVMPVPVFVTAFSARIEGSAVALSWEIAADEPMRGYRIYRGEGGGADHSIHSEALIPPEARDYVDQETEAGREYAYVLSVVLADGDEVRSQRARVTTMGHRFELSQNRPNPFNPTTTITFAVDREGPVSLVIYDVSGRRVRTLVDGSVLPGRYHAEWDGRDHRGSPVATGVYLYRLTAGRRTLTQKAVLLK